MQQCVGFFLGEIMQIQRGLTKEDAYKITNDPKDASKADRVISETLLSIFGKLDGDYFIHNSYTRKDLSGRPFKLFYVEDKDEDRHTIFFELVK
jgi:hypothetical protein